MVVGVIWCGVYSAVHDIQRVVNEGLVLAAGRWGHHAERGVYGLIQPLSVPHFTVVEVREAVNTTTLELYRQNMNNNFHCHYLNSQKKVALIFHPNKSTCLYADNVNFL